MAIENNDLVVLQKNGGGELRKATVQALLSQVVVTAPDLDSVTEAGSTTDNNISVGKVTTTEVDCSSNISCETLDVASSADMDTCNVSSFVNCDKTVFAGTEASKKIELNGTTGEITGGVDVFIDGGEYATDP